MDSFLSLILGFVIGVLFVLWDNKKGTVWYKRWYDLSHKEKLDAESGMSFIKNQPFSKRLVPAVILTALFSYGTWLLGDLNPIVTLITGMVSLIGVVIGFYVGPMVLNRLPKGLKQANQTLKKLDDLEKDLTTKKTKPVPEPEKLDKPIENKDDKKDDDWRKGVKDFLDK